ncbi:methylated-DNA--[protein]-cysteine S-methyltransferase [Christensenellaceae bacterium NSJ-44]|uniref:Methylated-DNA--protein-cysteine methyltransferase n=1 Tax=Luoshenia tenuis TaxID=2763654 RepID=A0A926HN35_9FIRM|nr:methylated-DNA--[protein]-cysteine S-methyltransferase [Luoshenia tenuis]MBC8529788.1 methylated-DNA--[protein]-cysteine S-methyltransferase [Luoshenia tenuis]
MEKRLQYIAHAASPLGEITLSSDGEALTGLWFDGQKYFGATLDEGAQARELPVFAQTRRWLEVYFAGREPAFIPPLRPAGSPFRQAVWQVMAQIPYGQTRTYGQLAQIIGRQRGLARFSAQAVGGAVGHNPISILLPCHRVVGADGSLTGYAGGVGRKAALLELEGTDMTGLFSPKKGSAL